MTVSLWAKNEGATNKVLINKGGNNGWYIQSGVLFVGGKNNGSFGAIVLNRWYHLAFTYNGSNITLYKDGEVVDGAILTGQMPSTNSGNTELAIGAHRAGGGEFNGSIDEVMIWNRALSETEIMRLYESPK